MEIISFKNLTFSYAGNSLPSLKGINFAVNKGEMVLVMGKSGCGKTTLLRLIKPEISPQGIMNGEIYLYGKRLKSDTATPQIGFVMQNPDSQAVCDTVYSELAFGLENLGIDSDTINRKIGDSVSFFGIERLLNREISTLSGGEKQLVSLCSAMILSPEILILDEPISRLDPVAAQQLISAVVRINREIGTTIIIAEHFCEGIFHACDKVLLMEEAACKAFLTPCECVKNKPEFCSFYPAAAQIFLSSQRAKRSPQVPLTVRSARDFLNRFFEPTAAKRRQNMPLDEPVLSCRDLWFRYNCDSSDILKGLDLTLCRGEIFTICGSNGSGKTTLLKCLAGAVCPYSGKIKAFGKRIKGINNGIAMLPQNAYDVFVAPTVLEDYRFAAEAMGKDFSAALDIFNELEISHLKNTHPYDLSGGEAQLCALGRVLLCSPKILLLDEPTKGLDSENSRLIGRLLLSLKSQGISIICISHSLDFAAEYSDRCALFLDGRLSPAAPPQEFFCDLDFYTTAARRICKDVFDSCVTIGEVCSEIRTLEGKCHE